MSLWDDHIRDCVGLHIRLAIGRRTCAGAARRFMGFAVAALLSMGVTFQCVAAADGGAFTTRDHDARGLAMGGATITLVGGDAAVRWNPSRLPFQHGRSVTVAHGDIIEDFSSGLTTISVAVPWGGSPTDEYGIGRSPRWAVGGFLSRFGLDEVAGSASWSETAVSGAVSRTFWDYAAAGVSLRYLNVGSDIEEGSANGAAADLAMSLETTDQTRAALVVRNIASTLRWKSGRDETLPISVDLAFSYTHQRYGAAEMAFKVDGDGLATTSIGAEAALAQGGLVLWGGFKRISDDPPRNVPSLGVGVPAGSLEIGYGASFDEDQAFGTTQRFSVSARF